MLRVWIPLDLPRLLDSEGEAPPDRTLPVESQPPSLLWIDDAIRPDDAVVRLLEMGGFRVECAGSRATGLAMAQRAPHVGIILDLGLPDIPELRALEALTRQQIPAPILVLTGYPDFNVAVERMRLGASTCQSATISPSDKWMGLVRALAEHAGKLHGRSTGLLSAHGALVRELVDLLEELHGANEVRRQAAEHAQSDLERLKVCLLHMLADSRLNVFLFLVCARALKLTLTERTRALPSVVREISGLVKNAAGLDAVTPDRRIQATLSRLADADTRAGQLREDEIARTLSVNRAHLGRLLRDATGFTFKQWRWGFRLRPTLIPLATSQEQVAQIAYSVGYGSLAQFDRDFRRMLHMTPTEYRQLVRDNSR